MSQTLQEQVIATKQQARESAWREYLELLGRSLTPEPGDVERLAEVTDTLGISEAKASEHLSDIAAIPLMESKLVTAEQVDAANRQRQQEREAVAGEVKAAIIERLRTADLRLIYATFDYLTQFDPTTNMQRRREWENRAPSIDTRDFHAEANRQNSDTRREIQRLRLAHPRITGL